MAIEPGQEELMGTIPDEQEVKVAWVRKWKKVILSELAFLLQPDGEMLTKSRIFHDDTDQASFEAAAYELRGELNRRAQ